MAGGDVEMTHAEMWDDSALIESWNEALNEYKNYHSIHAKGGNLEDIDLQGSSGSQARRVKATETNAVDQPDIEDDEKAADQTKSAGGSTDGQASPTEAHIAKASFSAHSDGMGGPATIGPQRLIGSVQDEGLKRLLMSWYYAGYYTGLHEGQQRQQQQQQRQQ